jgi:type IV secretion system protein VirD4
VLYRERQQGRVAALSDVVAELTDRHRTHDEILRSWLKFSHDPGHIEGWEDGIPCATHPVVAATAREQLNREEKERGAVLSSAVAPLTLFRDPLLAANTSRSDFTISDLMDAATPVTVYLVLRPSDIHRLRPIVRIFMDLALRRLVETMSFVAGQQLPAHRHKLLLMLDEFPVLGKLDIFSESLAYIRGWGIKAYLIAQDYEQLRAVYSDRETISSNCHLKIAYAPTKVETARTLSAMIGNTTAVKRMPRRGMFGSSAPHAANSEQEVARPLLTPEECMQLPGARKKGDQIVDAGAMLVLAAGSPAIYGRQTLYFLDDVLVERARMDVAPPKPDLQVSQGGAETCETTDP